MVLSRYKKLFFSLITLCLVLLFMEVASTLYVFHLYNSSLYKVTGYSHRSATVFFLHKAIQRFKPQESFEVKSSIPSPFKIPDSLHGFALSPGSFEITFRKREQDSIVKFKHYVTVNQDGSRFTGTPSKSAKTDVYVFGDSYVFGEGVNDEQTFTYILQSRFPEMRFHLLASPAYSLSNSYLSFKQISSSIDSNDIIILGHANFYEFREVGAPSWVKSSGKSSSAYINNIDPRKYQRVRVRMMSDSLIFDKIPYFCEYMGDYCQGQDPSKGYMDSVAALLINGIARNTDAKIFMLHFDHTNSNISSEIHPALVRMIDRKVTLINASSKRFDYRFVDDIEGFDNHPGPYWHYTMFRMLYDRLLAYKMNAYGEKKRLKSYEIE